MYFSPDSALIGKKGPLYTGENKMSNILDLIYFILRQIISQQYVCLDHWSDIGLVFICMVGFFCEALLNTERTEVGPGRT